MSLTITEKNHWMGRIAKRIERATEELLAKNDPTFIANLSKRSRQRAIESLGIEANVNRLEEIKAAIKESENERMRVANDIAVKLFPNTSHERSWYECSNQIEKGIKDRQTICEKELLSESPLGRKVMELRREQEELLDTVWLATSPVQIRQLWNQVGQLVGQEMTGLQAGLADSE